MDSNGFDDQIFTDFAGQLTSNQGDLLSRDGQPRSPNMHHSIQVMLGMQQQQDIIHQHHAHDKMTQEMMMSCSGSPVSANKMAAVHHEMGLYADHSDVPTNEVKTKLDENGQTVQATSTVESAPKKSEGGSKKKNENNGIKKKKTR